MFLLVQFTWALPEFRASQADTKQIKHFLLSWCRCRGHVEMCDIGDVRRNPVPGDLGKIPDECPETVDSVSLRRFL